jgi:hypothetical protein
VGSEHPSIVCLQETKLNVISPYDLIQIVGLRFDYFYLPGRGDVWRDLVSRVLFGLVGYQHIHIGVLHLSSVQTVRWWPGTVDDGSLRSMLG